MVPEFPSRDSSVLRSPFVSFDDARILDEASTMIGSPSEGVGARTTRSRETVSPIPEALMMTTFFADAFTTRYSPVAKDASLFRSGSSFVGASRRKKTNDPSRMSSADGLTAL